MPCNLAVSIAKAGVTKPQLLALLTPEIVQKVALTYLQQQYAQLLNPSLISASGKSVILRAGTSTISIENGAVEVNDSNGNRVQAEKLAAEMEQLILQLADQLFDQQIQAALGSLVQTVQPVTVDNDGAVQQATVFTLEF
jgi:ABC-type cobalamin/Fe3+-siderophores transport system ATPase subunit